jgi:hypothetical protein
MPVVKIIFVEDRKSAMVDMVKKEVQFNPPGCMSTKELGDALRPYLEDFLCLHAGKAGTSS